MQVTDVTSPMALGASCSAWQAPEPREILECALPFLGWNDRLLLRGLALLGRRQIVAVHGLQHIRPAKDPFILAINHGTHRESVLVPAMLLLHRGGRLIHFLADWNFRLLPGIGLIYRRSQVVTVVPMGIRFPRTEPGQRVPEHAAMELHIGAPLVPPGRARSALRCTP